MSFLNPAPIPTRMKWAAALGAVIGMLALLDGVGPIRIGNLFGPLCILLTALVIAIQVDERRKAEHGR